MDEKIMTPEESAGDSGPARPAAGRVGGSEMRVTIRRTFTRRTARKQAEMNEEQKAIRRAFLTGFEEEQVGRGSYYASRHTAAYLKGRLVARELGLTPGALAEYDAVDLTKPVPLSTVDTSHASSPDCGDIGGVLGGARFYCLRSKGHPGKHANGKERWPRRESGSVNVCRRWRADDPEWLDPATEDETYCEVIGPDAFICTRAQGHTGDHAAHGEEEQLERWPQNVEEPPKRPSIRAES